MKLSVLSRADLRPRAPGVSRREALQRRSLRTSIDIVGYEVPFTGRNLFPLRVHACGRRRGVRLERTESNFQIILRRAGERVRERRTWETPYLCGQGLRLKCNKSISVDFIFFPRFNLFPPFFFTSFSGTTLKHESELYLPPLLRGTRRTSLESGPLG